MAERIEIDLGVKGGESGNGLSKALDKAVGKTENLEAKLKEAVSSLNKPAIGASFQSALRQNALSTAEFKEGIGAAFSFAKKGADEAAVKTAQLASSLKVASVASVGLGESLKASLSTLFLNPITATITAILALISATKQASAESLNFKKAQLEIETILPKNTKLTAELVAELESLSEQYGTSATTQAKAYYQVISAGVSDASDGTKILKRANELATGGLAETGQTIDLLTTIYNVYGKELATTSEAADSLFKTVQIGKTTIPELAQDLGQALPIAKAFGIGLDEVGAILADLTNNGFKTAEATTILNGVLSAIAKNGDKLGVGFNSVAVQTDGLGVVLERLKERTNGSNDALFELLGRQEAVKGVQALTAKGLEHYNSVIAEYSNKAGVAAEASRNIVENDVGKQFDILSANALAAGRSIADSLSPALLNFLKIINAPSLKEDILKNVFNTEGRIDILRKELSKISSLYDEGKISSSSFAKETARINEEISKLSRTLPTASAPLALLATGLEKDAERIKIQITEITTGISSLNLGPIQRDLKLSELNKELINVNERLKELKSTAASPINEPPVSKRSQEILDAELELQADLQSIRQQFAVEDKSAEDQRNIRKMDDDLVRKEAEINAEFEKQAALLAITTDAEYQKTNAIGDEINKRLTREKIAQDASVKAQVLFNKKEKDIRDARDAEDKKSQAEREANQRAAYATIATLATSNNKTLATIGKAAGITQIAIDTPVAISKTLAAFPAPISFVLAGAVATAMAAQAARIAGVALAGGGIVGGEFGGAAGGGDDVQITARKDEMFLNAQQQKNLFDAINTGALSGGGDIVIKIDEREIARAVRNQRQQGFAV